MKNKMFDNSNMMEPIEWGNIPVGDLTDEELHSTNWEAKAKGKANAQDPDWQARQKAAQEKRKTSGWNKKMLGNKNGAGNTNRLGMTNSEESNARRSAALMGIERLNLRGVPKPKVICPHCGKEGGRPQMIQFHFDKCKQKQ